MMWDDEAGYDRDDPKHPGWAGAMLDRADDLRKQRKENPERFDGPRVSPAEFDKLTEGEAA